LLTRTWTRVGQRTVYRLAAGLLARTQRRSLGVHSRNSVGGSLNRIMGDSWGGYKVADTLFFTPKYAFLMIAGMVVGMARMDVSLMLLALAVAPVMAAGSAVFGRPIRRAARARREVEGRIHAHVQQTLSGIPVVQAFGQERQEQQRFEEFTNEAVRAQWRT